MIFQDYEPFLAMFKLIGTKVPSEKLQDLVYILQNLGYPLDEDFSLYTNGLYSEKLALTIGTMERFNLIQKNGFFYKLATSSKDIDKKEYSIWQKCISQLFVKDAKELSLVSIYLYLTNVGYKNGEIFSKLIELKFLNNKKDFCLLKDSIDKLFHLCNIQKHLYRKVA